MKRILSKFLIILLSCVITLSGETRGINTKRPRRMIEHMTTIKNLLRNLDEEDTTGNKDNFSSSEESWNESSEESGSKTSQESGSQCSEKLGSEPSKKSGSKSSEESCGQSSEESSIQSSEESGNELSEESVSQSSQESGSQESEESGSQSNLKEDMIQIQSYFMTLNLFWKVLIFQY